MWKNSQFADVLRTQYSSAAINISKVKQGGLPEGQAAERPPGQGPLQLGGKPPSGLVSSHLAAAATHRSCNSVMPEVMAGVLGWGVGEGVVTELLLRLPDDTASFVGF